MSCDKISNICAETILSTCVDHEGELGQNTTIEDGCVTQYDVNKDLYKLTDTLFNNLSTEGLGNLCIDYDITDGKILPSTIFSTNEVEICSLKDRVLSLESFDYSTLNISSFNLDYACLEDPCNNGLNTLKPLLQSLINKSCENSTPGNGSNYVSNVVLDEENRLDFNGVGLGFSGIVDLSSIATPNIESGDNTQVSGEGTVGDPIVINSSLLLNNTNNVNNANGATEITTQAKSISAYQEDLVFSDIVSGLNTTTVLRLSDRVNDLLGNSVQTLQQVTDEGNTTDNDIVVRGTTYGLKNISSADTDFSITLFNEGSFGFEGSGTLFQALFQKTNLTASRTLEIPNKAGTNTIALSVNDVLADDDGNITLPISGFDEAEDYNPSGAWVYSGTIEVPDATLDEQAINKSQLDAAIAGIPSGADTNIYNTHRLSASGGNIKTALVDIAALNISESKQHVLLIDQDVDLSAEPAGIIEIPKEIPTIVQRGFKFITPTVARNIIDGSTPIVGTVADNYVQLQINGLFLADKDSQVFEGDGLIWFGNESVKDIQASWYGITLESSSAQDQTDNVYNLQRAINTIVLDKSNRATTKLILPNGNIYLNSPVVAFACSVDEHPFLTGRRNNGTVAATVLNLEGTAPIKHGVAYGEATVINYTAKWGSAFILQGLRNSSVTNFKFIGNNNAVADNSWIPPNTALGTAQMAALRNDDGMWDGDVTTTDWIDDDIKWTNRQPYAAIVTDPFRISVNDVDAKYSSSVVPESTLDLYYGTNLVGHQNSWDVKIKNINCSKFVEFFVNTLTGQQGDTYVYEQIMIEQQPIGIAHVQDQSRDCKAYEIMAYISVWGLFVTTIHGAGIAPEIQSAHVAGGLKYLHVGTRGNGILKISNVYAESIYAVGASSKTGEYYDGKGIVNLKNEGESQNNTGFPAIISNSTFKIDTGTKYTRDGQDAYLFRPPTIKGFNIVSSLIGGYTGGLAADRIFGAYEDCNFLGYVSGQTTDEILPVDRGWANNPERSTLRRENLLPPIFASEALYLPNKKLYGFKSGIPLSKVKDTNINWKMIGRTIDEAMDYYTVTITGKATIYPDNNYLEFETSDPLIKVGDVVKLEEFVYSSIGYVDEINGTTVRLANFTKAEWANILNRMDINDELTIKVKLIRINKYFTPFVGTKNSNTEISIDKYAAYRTSAVTESEIETGDKLILPDGKTYIATNVVGSTITINPGYGGTLNGEWVRPLYMNNEAFRFIHTGVMNYSAFYEKGKRYEYYSAEGVQTDQYLICVKSGDFKDLDAVNGVYKANFLRYDADGKLNAYLDGENLITPNTNLTDLTKDFNYSGTTAERPGNNGFPTEYIPNGMVYRNTETTRDEIWNGNAFVLNNTSLKYVETIGDGIDDSFLIAHNLNTLEPSVDIVDLDTNSFTDCTVTVNDSNEVELEFAVTPTIDQYKVIIRE